MGSCVTKRTLGRHPHIVVSTQVTNDYDMSTAHSAQLARTFLFALNSGVNTGMEVQMVASEPFYRVMRVRGEYICRVLVGYSDDSAEALKLHTTSRVCSLGDVLDCQYVVDIDFQDQDLGVVGFAARFGTDTLSELSVYTAPVVAMASLVPFELQEAEGASLALVVAPYSKAIRQQRELRQDLQTVKQCFQGARNKQRSSMRLSTSEA